MNAVVKGILVLCLLTLLSCQKEEITADNIAIEASILVYVERFEAEASERGLVIYLEGLEAHLSDVDGENVIGQCISYSDGSREVVLDREYWEASDDLRREILVFHELGHCILGRGHDESRNADGTCTSIMHSGTGACRFNYTTSTRTGYLDELFGE